VIDGYPQHPSVVAGATLELRVSTDAPAFRVEFHRWGPQGRPVGGSGWLEGRDAPHHPPYEDWSRDGTALDGSGLEAWPAYRFPVGADWPSGVYVAVLVEGDGTHVPEHQPAAPSLDARHGRVLFVVRPAAPGRETSILYKVPLLTYHAYNQVGAQPYDPATRRGGWCLYTLPEPSQLPIAVPPTVSLRRPGGGTGGTPWDAFSVDPFDRTPRQTFVHWDALAVGWLEGSGYRLDYCTDLDLHEHGEDGLLEPYRLLLSFGHDEYWSRAMRTAVERFARAGGSVAFFSGNTCWWEVVFDEPFAFRRVHNWSHTPVPDEPENGLTGVSFRNGGERPPNVVMAPVGFEVQHADHCVYAGTGCADGDRFGQRAHESLVGYECDGANFDRRDLGRGRPVRQTGDDGTPEDFVILGIGDVARSGWGSGNRAATLGLHEPGGTVFTAATTDWARVLARGSPVAGQITANVLERLR